MGEITLNCDVDYVKVVVLAVGQGTANLIEGYDKNNQLVFLGLNDCGGDGQSHPHVQNTSDYLQIKMNKRAQQEAKNQYMYYLDTFILSHHHRDHYNILRNIITTIIKNGCHPFEYTITEPNTDINHCIRKMLNINSESGIYEGTEYYEWDMNQSNNKIKCSYENNQYFQLGITGDISFKHIWDCQCANANMLYITYTKEDEDIFKCFIGLENNNIAFELLCLTQDKQSCTLLLRLKKESEKWILYAEGDDKFIEYQFTSEKLIDFIYDMLCFINDNPFSNDYKNILCNSVNNKNFKFEIMTTELFNKVMEIPPVVHSARTNGILKIKRFIVGQKTSSDIVPTLNKKLGSSKKSDYLSIFKAFSELHYYCAEDINMYTDNNSFRIIVLNPKPIMGTSDENECSLLTIIEMNKYCCILTGDASNRNMMNGYIQQENLENCLKNTNCLLTTVPHHGSDTAAGPNSKVFYEMAKPKYCTISAGINLVYGLPTVQCINLLKGIQSLAATVDHNICVNIPTIELFRNFVLQSVKENIYTSIYDIDPIEKYFRYCTYEFKIPFNVNENPMTIRDVYTQEVIQYNNNLQPAPLPNNRSTDLPQTTKLYTKAIPLPDFIFS